MSTFPPPQHEGTPMPIPIPLPVASPPPSTQGQNSRPPSPSIDDISGFPRINTGCEIDSKDDSEFNTAAYPYPNSNATPVASPDLKVIEDPFAGQKGDFTFKARDVRDRQCEEGSDGNVNRSEDEDQGPETTREAAKKLKRALSDESDISKRSTLLNSPQKHKGSKGGSSRDADASKLEEKQNKHHSSHSSHFEKGWARMTGRRGSRGEKD